MSESQAVSELKYQLQQNHEFAESMDQPDFPAADFPVLQRWQRERLASTYRDLREQKRYRAATDFFLQELYGGLDFKQRDQEVARVLPIMTKLLPDHLLGVLAEALKLQHLSLELDLHVTRCWASRRDGSSEPLTAGSYIDAYHHAGHWQARETQIELIRTLGESMNGVVKGRLVHRLIRLLRRPARAAGFGELQRFLEDGLAAFHEMGDAAEFVGTIVRRERELMQTLRDDPDSVSELDFFDAEDIRVSQADA